MGWEQHGKIWDDDGEHSDEQVGRAASVRFVNPDLPGRRVTVYAYPHAPEKSIVTRNGSVETFHGFEHDMDSFGIETQIWREIDEDGPAEADDFNPDWSDIRYESLDTRQYSGPAKVMIAEAEQDALAWIMRYDPAKFIDWDGERF